MKENPIEEWLKFPSNICLKLGWLQFRLQVTAADTAKE
jgi:hypothetical protein